MKVHRPPELHEANTLLLGAAGAACDWSHLVHPRLALVGIPCRHCSNLLVVLAQSFPPSASSLPSQVGLPCPPFGCSAHVASNKTSRAANPTGSRQGTCFHPLLFRPLLPAYSPGNKHQARVDDDSRLRSISTSLSTLSFSLDHLRHSFGYCFVWWLLTLHSRTA